MSFSEFKKTSQNWSTATEEANKFYKNNDYKVALRFYQDALFYSELMIKNADSAQKYDVQIASPFFVSCINLANNFWEMGDIKKAGDYFFYNVWQLKMLSRKAEESGDMQFQAIKNWEKAVLSLIDFYQKTNQKVTLDFWNDHTYDQINFNRSLLMNRPQDLN